jgi:hypothetical protein
MVPISSLLLLGFALAGSDAGATQGSPSVGDSTRAAAVTPPSPAARAGLEARTRPPRPCPECDRRTAFAAAIARRDYAAADALVPAMLGDGERQAVAEYWVYARGKCVEALTLLDPVRRAWNPRVASNERPLLLSALVCEAARLEQIDPATSTALLAEALDKDMEDAHYRYRPELYHAFASQAVLNEPAMQFLRRRHLDDDRTGYAMEAQIWNGRVDNVRRLLELGANPNEYHGGQHSALGESFQLLRRNEDAALRIVDLLLAAGADPAMYFEYESASEKPPTARARAAFDARLSAANARLARSMPVRIDFYDFETMGARSRQPAYARFHIRNRSGSDVVLDSWFEQGGVEIAGLGARIEFRVAPGRAWQAYSYEDRRAPAPKGERRLLPDGERTLLYVPIDLYPLAEAPPGLQLRLRIPSASGTDYISTPFSLHDGRQVRAAWPRDPAPSDVYFAEGEKIALPKGMPKPGDGPSLAPHSHASQE